MHQTKYEIWSRIDGMTVSEVRSALESESGERRFEDTNLFKPPREDAPSFAQMAQEIGRAITNVARCAGVSEPRRLKLSNLACSLAFPFNEVARLYGVGDVYISESFEINMPSPILVDAVEMAVQVSVKHSMYQLAEVLEALKDGLLLSNEAKVGNSLRALETLIQARDQRALRAA